MQLLNPEHARHAHEETIAQRICLLRMRQAWLLTVALVCIGLMAVITCIWFSKAIPYMAP